MEVIALVLPLALGFMALAVVVCVRAIRSGQFDDLETPAVRVLFDDVPAERGETPSRNAR